MRRAGPDGVDLHQNYFGRLSRDCIKAHVWHLNRRLSEIGLKVVGERGGNHKVEWPYKLKAIADNEIALIREIDLTDRPQTGIKEDRL